MDSHASMPCTDGRINLAIRTNLTPNLVSPDLNNFHVPVARHVKKQLRRVSFLTGKQRLQISFIVKPSDREHSNHLARSKINSHRPLTATSSTCLPYPHSHSPSPTHPPQQTSSSAAPTPRSASSGRRPGPFPCHSPCPWPCRQRAPRRCPTSPPGGTCRRPRSPCPPRRPRLPPCVRLLALDAAAPRLPTGAVDRVATLPQRWPRARLPPRQRPRRRLRRRRCRGLWFLRLRRRRCRGPRRRPGSGPRRAPGSRSGRRRRNLRRRGAAQPGAVQVACALRRRLGRVELGEQRAVGVSGQEGC